MKSLRLRTLTAHASKVTPREHFLHELGLLSVLLLFPGLDLTNEARTLFA